MEGYESPTQPLSDDVEQDYDTVHMPHPLQRSQKRPMKRPLFQDEVDYDDQPDLHEYFSNWDISPKDIILMCRSYASYIAVQAKVQEKK